MLAQETEREFNRALGLPAGSGSLDLSLIATDDLIGAEAALRHHFHGGALGFLTGSLAQDWNGHQRWKVVSGMRITF